MASRIGGIAVAIIGVAVLLLVAAFGRIFAEAPGYRACVEAIEGVETGQPWLEAEERIARAVAAGGERWSPPVENHAGLSPDEVWVTCVRYRADLAVEAMETEPGGVRAVWMSVGLWAQMVSNGAFNRTRVIVTPGDGRVSQARLLDCLVVPIDTVDCREHLPRRRWWQFFAPPAPTGLFSGGASRAVDCTRSPPARVAVSATPQAGPATAPDGPPRGEEAPGSSVTTARAAGASPTAPATTPQVRDGHIGGEDYVPAAARDGSRLYVARWRSIGVYDLSVPDTPVEIGQVELPTDSPEADDGTRGIVDLAAGDGWLYALVNAAGLHVFDVRATDLPRAAGALVLPPPPGARGGGGPGMVLLGASLYAVVHGVAADRGTISEVVAIDVGDPTRPRVTGRREVASVRYESGDVTGPVAISGHLAIVAEPRDDATGTTLVLLGPAPDMPVAGEMALEGNAGVTAMAADDPSLYLIGYSLLGPDGGYALLTIDASDPARPREAHRIAFPDRLDVPVVEPEPCRDTLRALRRRPDFERRPHPLCGAPADGIEPRAYDAVAAGRWLYVPETYAPEYDVRMEELPETVVGLRVFDLESRPGVGPFSVGHLVTGLESVARDALSYEGYLYLALDDGRLAVVDARDPAAPDQGVVLHGAAPSGPSTP